MLHSWVFEVDIPINSDIDSNNDNSRNLKYESYDILVDCIGKRNKSHSNKLFSVQDCRSDLEQEITTKEDLDKENVLFITMEINGWPGMFAISKRDINKNEILYGHFGDGYNSKKKQVERQQQSVDYFVNNISKLLNDTTSIPQ